MNINKIFSKTQIYIFIFLTIFITLIFTALQVKLQLDKNHYNFSQKVNNEIKKSLNKDLFAIEGTITSLSNFYQASDTFSSANFTNISNNLLKYYPSIENIIYAQLINKEDINEFYRDIDNMGIINYKIHPLKDEKSYLPIVCISPNSFQYTKYQGYNLFDNKILQKVLENSSKSSKVKYYSQTIINENLNVLNIIKATYYGTITPLNKKELQAQTNGYFIISLNLNKIIKKLKKEFPAYKFTFEKNIKIDSNDTILDIFKSKIKLHNTIDSSIYVYKKQTIKNIFINKILVNNIILLFIILMIITILYVYKENQLTTDIHLKQLEKSEKLASMGEMIGNIAHQWRQPLSVISTASTAMQMYKEYGTLSDEKFNHSCEIINTNAQYLSQTIDDFKNYVKGDKEKKIFYLRDDIDSFLHLVEGTIKTNHIHIILDIQNDIKINGYELLQCFMNIFNNAKDALVEHNIKEKYIFISAHKTNQNVTIKIKDNAKGIPLDIINKIFNPYFTTKHQSQGTGLGLHMTYSLIVDAMDGSIEVANVEYTYNDNKYTGAEFTIILPSVK